MKWVCGPGWGFQMMLVSGQPRSPPRHLPWSLVRHVLRTGLMVAPDAPAPDTPAALGIDTRAPRRLAAHFFFPSLIGVPRFISALR
jgi:hypothetical protein